MSVNRRNFIILLGAAASSVTLGTLPAAGETLAKPSKTEEKSITDTFQLPTLPYDYDALEPYIDAETMRFHHDKHHAGYTNKLNAAVNKYPRFQTMSAEDLLRNLTNLPKDIRKTVRNNGGGYVNHKMFWEIMSPNGGGEPTGNLAAAINQTFGSFDEFKKQFEAAGSKCFGSGWVWLVRNNQGQLQVINTPNQDNPLLQGMYPIMGNDVWEHAYYLKYRNQRGEYLNQWWNVVNWDEVANRFVRATT
ncbi:MAG: superoxide dismutase [Coleofasciculaceae cyanobacterium]